MQLEQNRAEVDDIDHLIIEEYHKKENALFHFSRFGKEGSGNDEYDAIKEIMSTSPSSYNNLCAGVKERQEYSKTTRIPRCRLGSN